MNRVFEALRLAELLNKEVGFAVGYSVYTSSIQHTDYVDDILYVHSDWEQLEFVGKYVKNIQVRKLEENDVSMLITFEYNDDFCRFVF